MRLSRATILRTRPPRAAGRCQTAVDLDAFLLVLDDVPDDGRVLHRSARQGQTRNRESADEFDGKQVAAEEVVLDARLRHRASPEPGQTARVTHAHVPS